MKFPDLSITNSSATAQSWSRVDWWLLLTITALGALLRFYKLGQVPPGFQFDEAFNAIDAGQVLHGNYPLFLPANGGREVFYTYLQAGLGALFGVNVYTLRLTSALLGIATVAATFVLLRTILQRHSRAVATFTSLTLVFSVWHLHFSHYGIRVITMPLLYSALFGCYWLGMHGKTARTRIIAFASAGFLTGLSVWTNPTGRLVPFVLLGYALWLLWRYPEWRSFRLDRPLGGLFLTGALAFLVFLPLGLAFYQHPEWFTGHAEEVSIFADRVSGGEPWRAFLDNCLRVLGMFSFDGDAEWIHGPINRPVFDPLLSIPFTIGVLLWATRLWRRRSTDPDVDALLLLGLWTFVMLTPSMFSDAAPNYSRTLPALPAVFVAAGLGLTWMGQALPTWVARWLPIPSARQTSLQVLLPLTILAISGVIGFRDYFIRFPQTPQAYFAYEANKMDALAQLEAQADDYEIYLHPLWAEHPPVRFRRSSEQIKALDTAQSLVLPPLGRGAIYAYPPELAHQAEDLAVRWPGAVVEQIPDPYGGVLFVQVKLNAEQLADWPPTLQPTSPLDARFNDGPTLLGFLPNEDERLTLFWRGEERTTVRSLTAFIHLIDADGVRVGQVDQLPGNGSFPTNVWSVGERVIEQYQPEITDVCASGEAVQVQVGWYELAADGTAVRRPRADSYGDLAVAGTYTLPITSRQAEQFPLSARIDQPLTDWLTLAAFTVRDADLQAGAPLVVDLIVQPRATVVDEQFALQLSDGTTRHLLWQGSLLPAGDWPTDELICRRVRTRLPLELAAGSYELALTSSERSQPFTTLAVNASTRRFDVPALATPVEATIGNAVKLLGYTAEKAVAATDPLSVTLVWQATQTSRQNYTVFVHLLDAQNRVVAQSDAVPANGYAMTAWVAGEVVLDTHLLHLPTDLPPGQYHLAAGLYDPASGVRADAVDRTGESLVDGAVPLGEIRLP